MRAQCVICSELFLQSSVISATMCGHLFHHHCILQWNEHSKTCPQCRNKLTTSKSIVPKLYLDPGTDVQDELDATAEVHKLRNENDELQAELREVAGNMASLEAVAKFKDAEMLECEKQLATWMAAAKESKEKVQHFKAQADFFKKENNKFVAAELELIVVRKELQDYKSLQTMLDGSAVEIESILSTFASGPNGMKQIATYSALLKKELTEVMNSRLHVKRQLKELKTDLAKAHEEIAAKESQIVSLSFDNDSLRSSLKDAESELASTNKRVERLHKKLHDATNSKDTTFDRYILESPAPEKATATKVCTSDDAMINRKRKNQDSRKDTIFKLVKRRADENANPRTKAPKKLVPAIEDTIVLNSSPGDSSSSSDSEICPRFNIFQRRRRQASKFSSTSGASSSSSSAAPSFAHSSKLFQSYNGFGGHSKPETYPSGGGAGARNKIPKNKTERKLRMPKTPSIVNILIDLHEDSS